MKVVHVLRKPCSEPTVAANVLRWGTGALNVDGTRVGAPFVSAGGNNFDAWRSGEGRTDRPPAHGTTGVRVAHGRWPANMIIQHLPTCEQTGTREEPGYTVNRFTDGAKPFGGGAGHPYESEHVPPSTVPVWACGAGCPVAGLDAQSLAGGMHGAGTSRPPGLSVMNPKDRGLFGLAGHKSNGVRFGDTGGASRFFKQVGGKVSGEE